MPTTNITVPGSGGSGGFVEFIHYANDLAHNAAAQTFSANAFTTANLSAQLSDYLLATGGAGSSGSAVGTNDFTLSAGSYYGEVLSNLCNDRVNDPYGFTLGLYNVTDSAWAFSEASQSYISSAKGYAHGEFYISGTKTFEIRFVTNNAGSINSGTGATGAGQLAITLATASLDRRSQVLLWKR